MKTAILSARVHRFALGLTRAISLQLAKSAFATVPTRYCWCCSSRMVDSRSCPSCPLYACRIAPWHSGGPSLYCDTVGCCPRAPARMMGFDCHSNSMVCNHHLDSTGMSGWVCLADCCFHLGWWSSTGKWGSCTPGYSRVCYRH